MITTYLIQKELLKMLSNHYRNLTKMFASDASQFWKMIFGLKTQMNKPTVRNVLGKDDSELTFDKNIK